MIADKNRLIAKGEVLIPSDRVIEDREAYPTHQEILTLVDTAKRTTNKLTGKIKNSTFNYKTSGTFRNAEAEPELQALNRGSTKGKLVFADASLSQILLAQSVGREQQVGRNNQISSKSYNLTPHMPNLTPISPTPKRTGLGKFVHQDFSFSVADLNKMVKRMPTQDHLSDISPTA